MSNIKKSTKIAEKAFRCNNPAASDCHDSLIFLLTFPRNFKLYTQFYRIKGGGGWGRTPTDNFLTLNIYRWKGHLTANRIHFKYLKSILISRFYK